MRRRTIALRAAALLLVGWLCLLPGHAAAKAAWPAATDRFFVNDYAGILSDADARTVYEAGVRLYQATDAQVVLVTVQNTGSRTLEDYALGLARDWGIGTKEKNNGVLLLFTVDGPHSRIEVGSGLEGALPDSKAGRILDTYLVPWYAETDAWSEKLTDTYKALVNVTYGEYGMTEEQYPLPQELPEEGMTAGDIAQLVVLAAFLLLCIFSGLRRRLWVPAAPFGNGRHNHPGGFGGFGGFGGGGGFGRGGGGGFSGGGGGFSGGGASR